MNWSMLRHAAWLDTRAAFVQTLPPNGALLDLGSSDGETLGHMAELRPDLRLFSVDLAGTPTQYPKGCEFRHADLERDRLPWVDGSMDGITCMHLVEHLKELRPLMAQIARLLRAGGRVYFETPHPKTVDLPRISGKWAGKFTMNFYDDPTHMKPVPIEELEEMARSAGLQPERSGVSSNRLFAASHLLFQFLPPSRQKFTARIHWLGWSAFLVARKPL